MSATENAAVNFYNSVKITDKTTGEILLDRKNAIHPANLARVIARGLANEPKHHIYRIGLGNGGTYLDSAGVTRYQAANTVSLTAQLYNETYAELLTDTGNSIHSEIPSDANETALVSITMIIASDEPGADQWTTDSQGQNLLENPNTTDPALNYVYNFDELGLFSENHLYDPINNPAEPEFLLLTHLIFQPIAKSQNRELELTYLLTISVS